MIQAKRVLSFFFALLFAWAAISKISDMPALYTSLAESRLFPAATVGLVTLFVPALELTISFFLAAGYHLPQAAKLTAILIAIFIGWHVRNIIVGIGASECPCVKMALIGSFGAKAKIAMDVVLLGLAAGLAVIASRTKEQSIRS